MSRLGRVRVVTTEGAQQRCCLLHADCGAIHTLGLLQGLVCAAAAAASLAWASCLIVILRSAALVVVGLRARHVMQVHASVVQHVPDLDPCCALCLGCMALLCTVCLWSWKDWRGRCCLCPGCIVLYRGPICMRHACMEGALLCRVLWEPRYWAAGDAPPTTVQVAVCWWCAVRILMCSMSSLELEIVCAYNA